MIADKLKGCFRDIKKGAGHYWLYGLTAEAKSYVTALLKDEIKGTFLFITPEYSEARNIYEDLLTFFPSSKEILLLPPREKDSEGKRLMILHQLAKENNVLVVASLGAICQKVSSLSSLEKDSFRLVKGSKINRTTLLEYLVRAGYESSPLVEEKGDYASRGGIIDFYSPLYSYPIRIELFGETIESIREFDPLTQFSTRKRKEVILSSRNEEVLAEKTKEKLFPLFQVLPSSIIILDEPGQIQQQMENWQPSATEALKRFLKRAHLYLSTNCWINPTATNFHQKIPWVKHEHILSLPCSSLTSYQGHFDLLIGDIKSWREKNYKVILLAPNQGQGKRLKELFEEKKLPIPWQEKFSLLEDSFPSLLITIGDLRKGFVFEDAKQVFITDEDIFKRYRERRQRWGGEEEKRIKRWTELTEGDYVVHIDYGIGKFSGIETLEVEGVRNDYFRVDYKGTDRLYVPIYQLGRLHKYVGDSDCPPPIHSMEGGYWRWTKKRVRKAAWEIASSLLKLYSMRKTVAGHSFSSDKDWQLEFESSFPYEETRDQLKATEEIKQSMENPTPMDRLVCGDAGYGKTEVAIRAAFKAVMDLKQVALLAPTTILTEQHYRTFTERMAAYPICIEMLSRFQTSSKQKDILIDLKEGKIDIIIGTHRLIQKDVGFKNLGLVIIDEEQRFGVTHKKKLREFNSSVDVLSLSATPIPRSLYMSLVGIREMSTIFTPPEERQNIETEVVEYDEALIKKAITKELERGGQVFYLYNRIKDIYRVAEKIKRIVPASSIAVSHGRMPSRKLESVTKDFLERRYNILVCTTIIESGIDMPNVNTLIVEGAEQFGLADLYQLRGRVGRGRLKGYCYFLLTQFLREEARRRLEVINQFKGAGSGLRIAMQDLEIRGAGNLLGKEQHGHIAAVGFTLYNQLLTEEVKKLKGEKVTRFLPLSLDIGVEARILPLYVPYKEQRFELYRRMGKIKKEEEILKFKEELRDRYGPLPSQVRNLIHLLRIKLIARKLGIISLRSKGSKIWATFSPFNPLGQAERDKIKARLWPDVQPLPLDERNLAIVKKNKGKQLLIWLERILHELKDVI